MQIRQLYVERVILSDFILKPKIKLEYFAVPCEKSETISFAFSIMKNIVACDSRFPVKLICFIAFGFASAAFYLLESIAFI